MSHFLKSPMTGISLALWRWCCASLLVLAIAFGGNVITAHANPITPQPMLAALFHFSGKRPTTLGVHNGQLLPCPDSPNCVSTSSTDKQHAIAPLSLNGSPAETFQKLKAIVAAQPRAQIIEATDNYIYAEFTSALMGYVDDVEFYLDETAGTVQVRSASRLGQSDLGVNRQRIEAIRSALASA